MSRHKPVSDHASSVVLESESQHQFEELVKSLAAHYRPANQPERALIDRMAATRWLQMRAWATLRKGLDRGVPARASVLRIEAIHRRQFNSARGELKFLQDRRDSLAGSPNLTENTNMRFGPDPTNGHTIASTAVAA